VRPKAERCKQYSKGGGCPPKRKTGHEEKKMEKGVIHRIKKGLRNHSR